MEWDKLRALITLHEGKRKHAYRDTKTYLTIGVGRNIDRRSGPGLRECEIVFMLENDIDEAVAAVSHAFDFWDDLSEARQAVLVDMYHNLGPKLFKFKKTIKHISNSDYDLAADEMLDSLWAEQVGVRALRLSEMMRASEWPGAINEVTPDPQH